MVWLQYIENVVNVAPTTARTMLPASDVIVQWYEAVYIRVVFSGFSLVFRVNINHNC